MSKSRRSPNRLFFIWIRKWLKTSKPTEWITAGTACIGVLATITAAIVLLASGFFDQKKSELETRRSEIAMQNTKLEIEQKDLVKTRDEISRQIVKDSTALAVKQTELAATRSDLSSKTTQLEAATKKLGETDLQLTGAKRSLQEYVESEQAIAFIANFGQHFPNDKSVKRSDVVCALNIDPGTNKIGLAIWPLVRGKLTASSDIKLILNRIPKIKGLGVLHIAEVQLDHDDLAIIASVPTIWFLSLRSWP